MLLCYVALYITSHEQAKLSAVPVTWLKGDGDV